MRIEGGSQRDLGHADRVLIHVSPHTCGGHRASSLHAGREEHTGADRRIDQRRVGRTDSRSQQALAHHQRDDLPHAVDLAVGQHNIPIWLAGLRLK